MKSGNDFSERILFESFILGDWMTNAYFMGDRASHKGWVIDPGFSPEPLLDFLEEGGWDVEKILITHAHLDHIAGVEVLKAQFSRAEVLVHHEEAGFLGNPSLNLSVMAGLYLRVSPADRLLKDGDQLTAGDLSCRVIHTPGHSPGGCCFYFSKEELLLAGDTLFQGSVGRYDFPGSDGELLFKSVREKLMVLPDNTDVYPGHGPKTTIGAEKRTNPYIR